MVLVAISGDKLVTTSLAIAEGTGNEHKAVIQLIRNYQSDLEQFGGVTFEMEPFKTAGGMQKREIAYLNEHQATLIMSYMKNTEIIRAFKTRLVKTFYEMAEQIKPQFQIPKNYHEALQLAADQAKKLAEQQPLVEFAQAVNNASNSMDIGNFAKILGTGRTRMFAWLKDNGYFMSNSKPYQKHIENGNFVMIETTFERGDTTQLYAKPQITGKGQIYIEKAFRA